MDTVFQYCIDSPNIDEVIDSPFLEIRGWIVSDLTNKIETPYLCDPKGRKHILYLVIRKDVVEAFPNKSVIGFKRLFSISELYYGDKWRLTFLINGEQKEIILSFVISLKLYDTFLLQKQNKLKKIFNILRCPKCGFDQLNQMSSSLNCNECGSTFSYDTNRYNFLTEEFKIQADVSDTDNVSANQYDEVTLDLINKYDNGIILDNGAGLRKVYFENIVNLDVADYPTTDVLAIGEVLPFKSNVFDAVLSLAVIEHIKNPVKYVEELYRCLKPGGIVLAVVPFLQPFHGYPNHFYNMTSNGLKNLFEINK